MQKNKEKVVFLYVHKFNYFTKEDSDAMGGHPKVGRVYRGIKADGTDLVKIHVGAENNPYKLEGIVLKKLKGRSLGWDCDLEEITDENFFNLEISPSDIKKMSNWAEDDNSDIKHFIDAPLERPQAKSVNDSEEYPEGLVSMEDEEDDELIDIEHEIKLADALNTVLRGDTDFHFAMIDTIFYLADTFGDKYAGADIDTKGMLYSEKYGKGFNMGNALKYISRYCTEDFEKSNNEKDLLKAIHYILFELTRRRLNG